MIRRVFLDLDGVFADFMTAVHSKLGLDYDLTDYPYEAGLWDVFSAKYSKCPITWELAKSNLNHQFWANVPWMVDGKQLYNLIENTVCLKDAMVLTAPIPKTGAYSGKQEWVDYNLPYFSNRLIITTKSKGLFAGPGKLLIDDADKNIDAFIANGGSGILVPRPWNSNHRLSDNTVAYVRSELIKWRDNGNN